MQILWYVITAVVGILLGGTGMAIHDNTLPPKTVIQNYTTTQNVQTKSTAIQTVDQAQSTIILQDAKTNFKYVVVGGNGTTNRRYYFISKTNVSHKTNK